MGFHLVINQGWLPAPRGLLNDFETAVGAKKVMV